MATTKTLTPTNQTISIPELTDAPDMSVPADAIDKEADAINKLGSRTVAYKKDAGTLAALEADILDFAGNMSVNEVRPYTFWASADFSPFESGKIYEGTICLVGSNRIVCNFNSDSGNLISVGYNAGTWKFEQLSNRAEKKFQFSTFSAIPTSFVGLTAVNIGNTADPNCPYPTGTTMWWNVIQVGIETRLTQIASQAFATRPGKDEIWVRAKHDSGWSAWVKLAKNSDVSGNESETGYTIAAKNGCTLNTAKLFWNGKLVTAYIDITIGSTTAIGTQIANGLPTPQGTYDNAVTTISNSNSNDQIQAFTIDGYGDLKIAGKAATASRRYRMTFTYIIN